MHGDADIMITYVYTYLSDYKQLMLLECGIGLYHSNVNANDSA